MGDFGSRWFLMRTLEDIAKAAGVSTSTVSRALRGNSLVNAKTAERICQLAEEAGYKVNRFARYLATQRSNVIGLVIPDVTNPYFPQLIDRIVNRAKQSGYIVVPTLSGQDQADETACLHFLEEMRAEAIIIVTGAGGFPSHVAAQSAQEAGTRIVVLGWTPEAEQFDYVHADDPAGMAQLTRHLLDLGHTEIRLFAHRLMRGDHDRSVGFQSEMQAVGLWRDELLITGYADEALPELIHGLVNRKTPVTAMIGYNDVAAFRLMRSAQQIGLKVPDDLSVAGFDNLGLGEFVSPGLTTVDIGITEHAVQAIELLLDSPEQSPVERIVQPKLIVRESTAKR